jgi:hypothetical protein
MNTTPDAVAWTLPTWLKRVDLSRSGFYRELKAGRIKALKRGKSTIITAEAEREWLESLPKLAA